MWRARARSWASGRQLLGVGGGEGGLFVGPDAGPCLEARRSRRRASRPPARAPRGPRGRPRDRGLPPRLRAPPPARPGRDGVVLPTAMSPGEPAREKAEFGRRRASRVFPSSLGALRAVASSRHSPSRVGLCAPRSSARLEPVRLPEVSEDEEPKTPGVEAEMRVRCPLDLARRAPRPSASSPPALRGLSTPVLKLWKLHDRNELIARRPASDDAELLVGWALGAEARVDAHLGLSSSPSSATSAPANGRIANIRTRSNRSATRSNSSV